jgi:hypothetical protein
MELAGFLGMGVKISMNDTLLHQESQRESRLSVWKE